VCFLTVLGLLTVVLLGPVLALVIALLSLVVGLLAAVLPFAFIGLLAWVIGTAISGAGWTAWTRFRDGTRALARWAVRVPASVCPRLWGWSTAVVRALVPWAVSGARQAGFLAQQGGQAAVTAAGWSAGVAKAGAVAAWGAAGLVASVLLEMIGGAAVGAIFVGLADLGEQGPDFVPRLLAGIGAGAFVGLVVGVARSRRAVRLGG
jgi:hypothetical protein